MANEYGNYTSVNALSPSDVTLSEANTKVVGVGGTPGGNAAIKGTMALFENAYFEAEFTASSGAGRARCGIATQDQNLLIFAGTTAGYCVLSDTSTVYHNGGTLFTQSPTDTVAVGDRIGWLMTDDGFKINIDGSNWNSGNEIATGLTPSDWFIGCGVDTTGEGVKFYFHETDWENKPSGALPISTANLPTPAVVNYEDEYYIQAGISHSNGSTTAVTLPKTVSGGAMARIKRTDSSAGTSDWLCFDTIRGTNKAVKWNSQEAEDTSTYDDQNLTGTVLTLPSALTSGSYLIEIFYIGSYFQVKTYTGSGANKTESYPASLGSLPGFMAVISRTATGTFNPAWHNSLTDDTYYLKTDTNAAQAAAATMWNSTAPSATVLALGSNAESNTNLNTYVAYIWANSGPYAWGKYTGNGSTDGVMVNYGGYSQHNFLKSSSAVYEWFTTPAPLNDGNPITTRLQLQSTTAAYTTSLVADLISNGYKSRNSVTSGENISGVTYVYGAFGIQPLTDGAVNQGRAR